MVGFRTFFLKGGGGRVHRYNEVIFHGIIAAFAFWNSHLVESNFACKESFQFVQKFNLADLRGWRGCSESLTQNICYIIWLFNLWGSWPPQIPDQTQYLDNSPFKRVIKSVKAVCNTSPAFSALQLLVSGHLDCYDKNRIAIEPIQIREPFPNERWNQMRLTLKVVGRHLLHTMSTD